VMADEIDKTNTYNGISKVNLTTRQVRSKLRDPNTARNGDFIARCQTESILSSSVIQQKPDGFDIGRIENTDGTPQRAFGEEFPGGDITEKIELTNNARKSITVVPAQLYNPELNVVAQGVIDARTPLSRGIKLGTFLGGHADPVTINHIIDEVDRVRIAKNLYLHAKFMEATQRHLDRKNKFSISVSEGFYKPEPGETLEIDSINELMSKGRAVVYEVRDRNGLISLKGTFDLALHVKDFENFEKMILSYDSYNPDGSLHAEIIMIMPEVTPLWKVEYDNKIETRYNNIVQTNGELVEIL